MKPDEACCTCATLLSAVVPRSSSASEKPLPPAADHEHRRLPCCARVVCAACLAQNHRYRSYCPYCQIPSSSSSSDPPPYHNGDGAAPPPPYSPQRVPSTGTDVDTPLSDPEKAAVAAALGGSGGCGGNDTLHFLDHANDSIASLSLRYGVPAGVLRRTNNLPADHLLAARRTLLIPGTHYRGGVSLSPRPVEGEAEAARKAAIRRFMVACKVPEYDVAVFYLDQAGYDFSAAVETFLADEAWERENPLADGGGKRSSRRGVKSAAGTVGGKGSGWFSRNPK